MKTTARLRDRQKEIPIFLTPKRKSYTEQVSNFLRTRHTSASLIVLRTKAIVPPLPQQNHAVTDQIILDRMTGSMRLQHAAQTQVIRVVSSPDRDTTIALSFG
ncbi:MAG: hypothetical protein ACK42I_06100, partial [Thermomicrobium sp.]